MFDLSLFLEVLPRLYIVVGLVALDVLVGALAAFKAKEFDWEKFPGFLQDYGLKIFGWLVFELISKLPGDLLGLGGADPLLAGVAFAALVGGALASVLKNAQFLFGMSVALLQKAGVPERDTSE
ncbi:MAG TPA: hypothetical protein VJ327_09905 [Patescibacteria group bacterium]|nr:hypothetical protein [Patescibacteria group bacterium]